MPADNFFTFILAVIIALTIHEAAHAYVAHLLGDDTAKHQGRISLNPVRHLDLWGSLLFLFAGIGWGKPVPVNPHYFKNPKRDQSLVSLAGPTSNFILAALLAIPLKFLTGMNPALYSFLYLILDVNIMLCALNLLPIPPLDGSKIFAIFVPQQTYYKYSKFLEANLSYIILFFMADMYLFQSWFGFSFIQTILGYLTGILKTAIFLGT